MPILKKKKNLTSHSTRNFRIIISSFLILILVGAFLLMLPISSQSRTVTRFDDALFTAVSATCVTGLVVKDTATYWSAFGKAVILLLIQIGGMGVITIGLAIITLSGKRIGLSQRSTMQESISAPQIGGIIRFTSFILKASACIELSGAVLLMPFFCKELGFFKGIWYSFWHSISAFCNAGFDLMGFVEKFSSLTAYKDSIYLNAVVMLLIIIGGIGFLVWHDVIDYKFNIRKYSLQSKVALATSAVLIVLPAIYMFFFEYSNLPLKNRILYSLFQSVTTRTAGFNTTDLSQMKESGTLVMILLMLVGGSPGSTAGGMKTTTFAVLFLAALSVFGRKKDVECFKRRIPEDAARNAGAVLFMYMFLFIASGIFISNVEHLPLLTCLFETGSAVGTVGLTLGITSTLSLPSRIVLMMLMFFGRVGGLTLIYAALPSNEGQASRLPLEKITIG